MGKKEDDIKAEEAFSAGFEDKEFDVSAEIEIEDKDKVANELAAKATEIDDKTTLENAATTDTTKPATVTDPVVDEWEGIPDNMRKRFETMSTDLAKATQIANSASGRANKLQSALAKQNKAPVEAPKPTKDQILEALTDQTKRDELRENFGDFASALDEMDKSVSNSVGAAMDNLRTEMTQQNQNFNNSAMAELQVKRNLDIKHPGWETTVKDKEFKDWAYEGGPTEQQRQQYEFMLTQAVNATPEDSGPAHNKAAEYYNDLLTSHPVWAATKGSLYGDSSGESAVALLDNFKATKTTQVDTALEQSTVNKNKQRLEENIAPTSGNGLQPSQSDAEDVEKAFSDGFNNSTY